MLPLSTRVRFKLFPFRSYSTSSNTAFLNFPVYFTTPLKRVHYLQHPGINSSVLHHSLHKGYISSSTLIFNSIVIHHSLHKRYISSSTLVFESTVYFTTPCTRGTLAQAPQYSTVQCTSPLPAHVVHYLQYPGINSTVYFTTLCTRGTLSPAPWYQQYGALHHSLHKGYISYSTLVVISTVYFTPHCTGGTLFTAPQCSTNNCTSPLPAKGVTLALAPQCSTHNCTSPLPAQGVQQLQHPSVQLTTMYILPLPAKVVDISSSTLVLNSQLNFTTHRALTFGIFVKS